MRRSFSTRGLPSTLANFYETIYDSRGNSLLLPVGSNRNFLAPHCVFIFPWFIGGNCYLRSRSIKDNRRVGRACTIAGCCNASFDTSLSFSSKVTLTSCARQQFFVISSVLSISKHKPGKTNNKSITFRRVERESDELKISLNLLRCNNVPPNHFLKFSQHFFSFKYILKCNPGKTNR